jgi:hypothetical protein
MTDVATGAVAGTDGLVVAAVAAVAAMAGACAGDAAAVVEAGARGVEFEGNAGGAGTILPSAVRIVAGGITAAFGACVDALR